MKNDKVSVIIPVYNSEKFLKSSIESVLNQSYENFEIIAVDDGSTDSSTEILQQYDSKIEVISQKNPWSGEASVQSGGPPSPRPRAREARAHGSAAPPSVVWRTESPGTPGDRPPAPPRAFPAGFSRADSAAALPLRA